MNHISCSKPIIEIKGLTKKFKNHTALADVDLDIFPGQIIGLMGPNGCGKSTLIRHIIGLYLPTKGSCVTFGCETAKLSPRELSRIGYVHQEGQFLNWMTTEQLIRYVSVYYPSWNKSLEEQYVHKFEIDLKCRVGALSPGQRQKLAVLLAAGHEPELLILDEPASALDPIARAQFLELLLNIIQQEGKTILIASHILTDVEKAIDHIIMMNEGRVILNQGIDNIREQYLRVCIKSIKKELPQKLPFEMALSCQRDNYQAILIIERQHLDSINNHAKTLNYLLDYNPLPLEDLYKIIIESHYKSHIIN